MTSSALTSSVPNIEWERSTLVRDAVFVRPTDEYPQGEDKCTQCVFNPDRNDQDVNNCRIHQCRGGQWVSVLTAATMRLER